MGRECTVQDAQQVLGVPDPLHVGSGAKTQGGWQCPPHFANAVSQAASTHCS